MATVATAPARRDDIQGLRAIGALLVAIYHIWVGRVSGGVDVFFVVSGYLLIGSLGRWVAAGKRIDLIGFVADLCRRLLPASYLVIAAILVTGPFWLPRMRWDMAIDQLAASTLYLENWYLAFAAVDYLRRDEVGSPFQHYWAMSAQVQALILCAALLAALSWSRWRTRAAAIALLAALFLGSLGWSIAATAHNQAFAYYDTAARIWEFALGGLVALLLPAIRLGPAARTIGGWIGLAGILSCGVLLEVSTLFPGYVALWPTLSAALILICGEGPPLRGGVARLLAARPLVRLGDISYGLYLWHWPVLVAYLTLTYRAHATAAGGVLVLAASILLAMLATRFVEAPLRAAKGSARRWRTMGATAAAVVAIGVAGAGWKWRLYTLRDAERARIASAADYPGAAAMAPGVRPAAFHPVHPGPITAASDRADLYRDGCHESLEGDVLRSCRYGRADAPFAMAIVGGSHSAQWLPALQAVIARHPEWRLVTYTKSSCLMSAADAGEEAAYRAACARWNARLLARLLAERPALIFTTATRAIGGTERVPPGFVAQWQRIAGAGLHIAAVRDNPWFGYDVPECVEINGPAAPACARPRSALAATNPALALALPAQVHMIDLTDRFCDAAICPAVIGNIQVISDRHHVTATYMRTLADQLEVQLRPAMAAAVRPRS